MTTPDAFADRLAAALTDRGLSLDRVQAHLAAAGCEVSVATLSYWRAGRSRPWRDRSFDAVAELERILRVPAGHLIPALPTRRRAPWNPLAALPHHEATAAALNAPTIDLIRRWTRLYVEDLLVIDAQHRETHQITTMIVEAKADGARTWPIVTMAADPDARGLAVSALAGCEIADARVLADAPIAIAEVVLPRALRQGERAHLAYRVDFGATGAASCRLSRSLPGPTRVLSLGVRFDGDAPTGHHTSARSPRGDALPVGQATLVGDRLQATALDAQTGLYQLAWDWPDTDGTPPACAGGVPVSTATSSESR